jgi:hypothetical protein
MKIILKGIAVVLLLGLVFLPSRLALAAPETYEGHVVFGDQYTLGSGETLTGDLLVFGGAATIEVDAIVDGSIVLFGGKLTVDGEVTGDIASAGAIITLGPAAYVHGDLITLGATLERAETARVDGQIFNSATSWSESSADGRPVVPEVIIPTVIAPEVIIPEVIVPEVTIPEFRFDFNPLRASLGVLGNALGLGLLAMVVALFLAPQAGRVAHAVVNQPLAAGGVGLLVVFLAPIALVLMAITLILIPVAGLLAVIIVIAGVFGWIAIGMEVGRRFTRAIHQTWHPSLEAGAGTFALTLVAAALVEIPVINIIGILVLCLLGLAALGGVVMTRFGTQFISVPAAAAAPLPVAAAAVVSQPEASLPPLPPVPPEAPRRRKKTG